MKLAFLYCALLTLILLNSNTYSFAQSKPTSPNPLFHLLKNKHARKTAFPPKVILVQLRSESSKLNYFLAHNLKKEFRLAQKDASNIRRVTKNDFEENFKFCPVFYFIDSNLDYIKQQDFQDHVFTANGIPMPPNTIRRGDTNYFIVYYGHPQNQYAIDIGDQNLINTDNGEVLGKGLIFMNYRYEQVDYYVKFDYETLFSTPDSRFFFKSENFDMQYFPFAADYENDLEWVYHGIPKVKKLSRYKP
jgi:hypothetical protein